MCVLKQFCFVLKQVLWLSFCKVSCDVNSLYFASVSRQAVLHVLYKLWQTTEQC